MCVCISDSIQNLTEAKKRIFVFRSSLLRHLMYASAKGTAYFYRVRPTFCLSLLVCIILIIFKYFENAGKTPTMEVYEFEKSLLTRLEESCNVLQCTSSQVPASGVREEWACHVEMKIEPAGEFAVINHQ